MNTTELCNEYAPRFSVRDRQWLSLRCLANKRSCNVTDRQPTSLSVIVIGTKLFISVSSGDRVIESATLSQSTLT